MNLLKSKNILTHTPKLKCITYLKYDQNLHGYSARMRAMGKDIPPYTLGKHSCKADVHRKTKNHLRIFEAYEKQGSVM